MAPKIDPNEIKVISPSTPYQRSRTRRIDLLHSLSPMSTLSTHAQLEDHSVTSAIDMLFRDSLWYLPSLMLTCWQAPEEKDQAESIVVEAGQAQGM